MEVWQHIPFIFKRWAELSGAWQGGVIVRDGEHAAGREAARCTCPPD